VWSLAIATFAVLLDRPPYPHDLEPHVVLSMFRRHFLPKKTTARPSSNISPPVEACNVLMVSQVQGDEEKSALSDVWPNFDSLLSEAWRTKDQPTLAQRTSLHSLLMLCTHTDENLRPSAEGFLSFIGSF
jgi:hypothetical protein